MPKLHFDQYSFYIRTRDRLYTVPTFATIFIIFVVISSLALVVFHGPVWAKIIALGIIALPSALILLALIWFGGAFYADWLTARWYRVLIGCLIAAALILIEAFDVRWFDREPIPGYWFAGAVSIFLAQACYIGWRNNRCHTPSKPRYPSINVRLVMNDADGFYILRSVSEALRNRNVNQMLIDKYVEDATAGGFVELMNVTKSWVTVEEVWIPTPFRRNKFE